MKATYYNIKTSQSLFSVKIDEIHGDFEEYLSMAGYEYIKYRQCWVNKRLGVECIIWDD